MPGNFTEPVYLKVARRMGGTHLLRALARRADYLIATNRTPYRFNQQKAERVKELVAEYDELRRELYGDEDAHGS